MTGPLNGCSRGGFFLAAHKCNFFLTRSVAWRGKLSSSDRIAHLAECIEGLVNTRRPEVSERRALDADASSNASVG